MVELWGSGEPYREFLYVEDLADACVLLMENYDYNDIGEFINIGTGEDIKVKDLANMIKDIVGFEGEVRHDLAKPDGTPKKLLDISRMKALGWEPRVSLEEGIRKCGNIISMVHPQNIY
ncbi:MAG: NAD-dependent epimerase/dehydratase family protein [Syntrophales bacterium]|nr:NAD-dependent epimerase/dehydratase family protein [Syntrophales bacterium]